MRGLCGWFTEGAADGARAASGEVLQRMLGASPVPVEAVESRAFPGAGLAVFGSVARPRLVELDGLFLAVAGHPRLLGGGGSRNADLAELARALITRGKEALADIGGDFALAAWDSRKQRGLLAVDRIGVHQLVYTRVGDALAFATTLDLLAGYPGATRTLSPQALYDYLYYHVVPGPQTVYAGMQRVPPGHCIEFGAGSTAAQPRPYWRMRFTEELDLPVDELKRQFTELLQASVREAAEGAASGAFLSGGTDSSTVSGTLGRVSGQPARTFSIGFDVPGYDETAYARIAARHFGCDHHEYYVTPKDVVETLPRVAASYDQPFGNASAVPAYHCARVARENGVLRMLAGDGGDELFGGNERYAKHHLLGLYGRVPSALRGGLIEPLVSLPGVGALAPLRKLRSYVEQAKPAMPARYESYNLLQHLGVGEVLTPEFQAAIDTGHPRQLLTEAHAPFAGDSLINQMLGIDLRFILADGDLPKVTHMCNLAGVDVTFPLLDDRIIDFSRQLPSDLKLRGTKLRWFFKQALLDFLPPEIITKQKHGFGLPVGHWLLEHKPLHDLAVDSINLLKPRGIVRPQFVNQLLDVKLKEHPGYFGTMVWILMMLGLWLDSRKL
jgi:asparagine synthase (glutamine-hydrolysing)